MEPVAFTTVQAEEPVGEDQVTDYEQVQAEEHHAEDIDVHSVTPPKTPAQGDGEPFSEGE